eukprot:1872559-Prorocentrum_lima.AAC.1
MTSSLVGSEMCIRDSPRSGPAGSGRNQPSCASADPRWSGSCRPVSVPVSYTHLTLPTICSV